MAELARRGEANGVEAHELDPAHARPRAARAGDRRAVGALHRGLRLPRSSPRGSASSSPGGRGDPPRPVGDGARAPRADVVVRSDGRTCSATQVVACAGLRCDELARRLGRRPRRADRAVPRRVRGLLRPRGRARARAHLPGARPGVPVPRGARHPRHRRARARGAQRRAGHGQRGLRVGHGEAPRAARVPRLSGHDAGGRQALALRAGRGAPLAVEGRDGSRCGGCYPTSGP